MRILQNKGSILNIIRIVVPAVLILLTVFLFCSVRSLRMDISRYRDNEKAYISENDSIRRKSLEYELTINQLENANDSISLKVKNTLKELDVQKRRLSRVEYIETRTEIHDSIVLHDTILPKDFHLDTALTDNNWYDIELGINYPGTFVVDPIVRDEYTVVSQFRRVISGTPSKVFFIRWFQKRDKVVETDVHNGNPYVTVETSRFINIVK